MGSAPFLYSTNGEIIWFRESGTLDLSAGGGFHTPAAFERFGEGLRRGMRAAAPDAHEHPLLRPYQRDANAAVDKAIAERKRHMLVAMATGTGKTFTFVKPVLTG